MIRSMTAFASRRGSQGSLAWEWDLRGVNGRGLEIRLRLPEGVEGLEPAVRTTLSARLARGNVSLALRLSNSASEGEYGIDESQLDRVLSALNFVQERAFALGVTLGQPTAADVLAQRGVLVAATAGKAEEDLIDALLKDLSGLLDDFVAAREAEGRALSVIVSEQVDTIARLTEDAVTMVEARRPQVEEAFRASLGRAKGGCGGRRDACRAGDCDPCGQDRRNRGNRSPPCPCHGRPSAPRRCRSRRSPARLPRAGVQPRANTLLSKAGNAALSSIGLDLKATIDQMREQVQNVE